MVQQLRIGNEPIQKPGKSKQDYGTPIALVDAIEARWDVLRWDLAATDENAKANDWYTPEQNALVQHWAFDMHGGIGWLNPPFGDIEPWARKCAEESKLGAKILMLTPASIGAEWFAVHCEGVAKVIGLRPRLTFEGCKDPYPKDCMLTVWGDIDPALPAFSTWRWK